MSLSFSKKTAIKILSAVICAVLMFSICSKYAVPSYAEEETSAAQSQTDIRSRLQERLEKLVEAYNSSDNAELRKTIEDLMKSFGIDQDLSQLDNYDIGKIVEGLSNGTAMQMFNELAGQATSAGIKMIQDVINGGKGTSDGKNTATTTNASDSNNSVVKIPAVSAPTTHATTTNSAEQNQQTTNSEQITYNIGQTTIPETTVQTITAAQSESASVTDDEKKSTGSRIAVLLILSIATVAVVVAMVVFFLMKKH